MSTLCRYQLTGGVLRRCVLSRHVSAQNATFPAWIVDPSCQSRAVTSFRTLQVSAWLESSAVLTASQLAPRHSVPFQARHEMDSTSFQAPSKQNTVV